MHASDLFYWTVERQPVVLDLGHQYCKVGYAMESRPRVLVRYPELQALSQKPPKPHEEWLPILEQLLRQVYFVHLKANPKERRVVVCEHVCAPQPFRTALTEVLFGRFCVPQARFVLAPVLPLYLTGLMTGYVVDIGYSSTRVMPVFAGVPVYQAFVELPLGAKSVDRKLVALLDGQVELDATGFNSKLEAVKAQCCYCRVDEEPEKPATELHGVKVPAKARWEPAELFFAPGDEAEDTLVEAIVESLGRCPIDVRAVVLANLVPVGGCAELAGFKVRLALELMEGLTRDKSTLALASRVGVANLRFPPSTSAWLGGAVVGALDAQDANVVTLAKYEEGQKAGEQVLFPDWTGCYPGTT